MIAQQKQVDTVSNNISNVNTVGFKKSRVEFADLFYQVMKYAGTSTSATTTHPTGIEVGLGVRPTAVTKIFDEGSYKYTSTDNFDVAIRGKGFFQIQMPEMANSPKTARAMSSMLMATIFCPKSLSQKAQWLSA